MMSRWETRGLFTTVALASLAACGDRPAAWDTSATSSQAVGLDSAVALVDDAAHRTVFVSAKPGQEVELHAEEVGHGVVSALTSPDLTTLFTLSTGDFPRKSERDQKPSLQVFQRPAPGADFTGKKYDLSAPLSGVAIDPEGRYAALYAAGKGSTSFVENPNEIVLVDLKAPAGQDAPVSRTLRSFGGRPQRLTYTPTLNLPGGTRRLLVVETEQDVSIVDLDHMHDAVPRPEITVRLTSGANAQVLTPAGVVFDDGDPTRADDARIGIRVANDTNVVTLTLGPSTAAPGAPPPPNDFTPTINLTDVGGVASDIRFVRTDGGLRLAALVPSARKAVLVEPDTSLTTDVQLDEPFQQMSLITSVVGGGSGTDVALLYGASSGATSGVAFWALGKTSGQPYRSVEVLGIAGSVTRVIDVPAPHPELKVLQGSGDAFYVLNLATRTAAPLTTLSTATLDLSRDGERLWAFQKNTQNLSLITLGNVHPVPLYVDLAIDDVFDIDRLGGGHALVALHRYGSLGVTVFDADIPDAANSRTTGGLLLGGL